MSEITLLRPRGETVRAPTRILIRAGADAHMVEDFRALADATAPEGGPRYGARTVLEPLAQFLVRGSAMANRDAALYELCHLVNAVDASGRAPDRRNAFFLGPESASPARFQARFEHALARSGWRRSGFTAQGDGIAVRYADVAFKIHYGRMPFLAALYEFLAGMENFAFYSDLQTILDEMSAASSGLKAIQAASNQIASRLRHYRRRTLATAQQDGKFDAILSFLMGRSPPGRLSIDDESVLAFWCAKAAAGDFRTYRTVFDSFGWFLCALEEAQGAEAMAAAQPIGTDRANREVEPDNTARLVSPIEWESPLAALDEEPAAAIKFFKKEGERRPIEALMQHGPLAMRLPLAFLRLETFGPIQSAITTDLQVGRGEERLVARLGCQDAVPYRETVAQLAYLLDFIRRLQKATFYALHRDAEESWTAADRDIAGSEALDDLMGEARKAFRAVGRKGFDEAGLADGQRVEGFRIGATVLVAAAQLILRYLDALRARGSLEEQFAADCTVFSRQFALLYGVAR
jgi:hypothetical protein